MSYTLGYAANRERNLCVDLAEQGRINGGFTFRVSDASHPMCGYAVAVAGHEVVLPSAHELTGKDVADYWHSHCDAFDGPEYCLGAWFNPTANAWYLDVSRVFDDLDSAIAAGRRANQIAVYDLEGKCEVRCDYLQEHLS